MEYEIAINADISAVKAAEKLEKNVKRWLQLGWRPTGGVSVVRTDHFVMTQALTRGDAV